MRYATLSAKAALALVLPFILAHCASLLSDRLPLKYDEKSVGGPNSGAPLQLWLPPGNGPFPTVLVMHGCGGILDNHRSWAGRLVGWGYAAVIVDSFGPRNQRRVCENVDSIPTIVRGLDAHNAATYLRTLPNIQADRIGIVGFSHGGGATFYAAIDERIPRDRGGRPFRRQSSITPHVRAGRTWSRLPRTCWS
jgi:predicted alpha/beta-fold hydrolase